MTRKSGHQFFEKGMPKKAGMVPTLTAALAQGGCRFWIR
jgi:hypothetical protein